MGLVPVVQPPALSHLRLDFFTLASMQPAYTPYIGTLREHITKVLEALGKGSRSLGGADLQNASNMKTEGPPN